ncbi:hypothetical protein Ancab_033754 [Ancistrocladus abbreviatus]
MSISSSSRRICFNRECNDFKTEWRKGWRLQNGEFAELCDRCASAFEEGRFCETFHPYASGWRCCESCGKRIHCGCIVSVQAYILLDAGGIDCMMCARKNPILASRWPGSLLFPLPDRLKETSVRNQNKIGGTDSVGLWWTATNSFNSSATNSNLQSRMPFVLDVANGNKILRNDHVASPSVGRGYVRTLSERLMNRHAIPEMPDYGNAVFNSDEQPISGLTNPLNPSIFKDKPCTPNFALAVHPTSLSEIDSQALTSGVQTQPMMPPLVLGMPTSGGLHNGLDSSCETQIQNAKSQADGQGRNHVLPRYWPRISDQELQQISGDSKSVITPLFEKMLSASDAGRIGRLVLPKKCAETYFPPISQPEGLPLRVQDVKGNEWVFQFRFWPNNNSRMYVLEGITPCIQSMQLQAGDIVTFNRLEPEGKLVMGFRKASTALLSDQAVQTNKTVNGMSTQGDVNAVDPPSAQSKVNKLGYIAKESVGGSLLGKRKNGMLGSKSKRPRLDNADIIEITVSLEEAQGLFQPAGNDGPNVVIVGEFEIEEYEDAPVIGRPAVIARDSSGEHVQWVHCDNCFKWRKLPADVLLPARWTCSENSWDLKRSSCDAVQDLTTEQLEDTLSMRVPTASNKLKSAKPDPDPPKALERLDTLANLAILEEGESLPSFSHTTTKHPGHRPGCSCIVCLQPPSGKGPKHEQTCTCNVCLSVQRRFQILLLWHEKKQSEKEAETARKKLHLQSSDNHEQGADLSEGNSMGCGSQEGKVMHIESSEDDPSRRPSISSLKCQIDLNIQPERDEELSPGSGSGSIMKLLQDATERFLGKKDATERYPRQQRPWNSGGIINSDVNQTGPSSDGSAGDNPHDKAFPIDGNKGGAMVTYLRRTSPLDSDGSIISDGNQRGPSAGVSSGHNGSLTNGDKGAEPVHLATQSTNQVALTSATRNTEGWETMLKPFYSRFRLTRLPFCKCLAN